MNSLPGTAGEVDRWLRRYKHVRLESEWLKACIQWLKEESDSDNLSLSELKEKIYEQWLYSDLRECGEGFLPDNLKSVEPQTLHDVFCLQVNSVINVGSSAYSQILQLKGQEVNDDDETTSNNVIKVCSGRMLFLSLTDGQQTVDAMEYRPVGFALSEQTPPGTKILIKGPVQCRLGAILLTSSCVEVLGGQVDSLCQENSTMKVLWRAIGKEDVAESGPIPSTCSQQPPTTASTVTATPTTTVPSSRTCQLPAEGDPDPPVQSSVHPGSGYAPVKERGGGLSHDNHMDHDDIGLSHDSHMDHDEIGLSHDSHMDHDEIGLSHDNHMDHDDIGLFESEDWYDIGFDDFDDSMDPNNDRNSSNSGNVTTSRNLTHQDQHKHTHLDQHSHTHLDQHSHTHLDQHSHTYLDQHSHTHLDQHSHTHLDQHNHTHLDQQTLPHNDLSSLTTSHRRSPAGVGGISPTAKPVCRVKPLQRRHHGNLQDPILLDDSLEHEKPMPTFDSPNQPMTTPTLVSPGKPITTPTLVSPGKPITTPTLVSPGKTVTTPTLVSPRKLITTPTLVSPGKPVTTPNLKYSSPLKTAVQTVSVAGFRSRSEAGCGVVKIRAKCIGTVQKLMHENNQWSLHITIQDGTGSMAVCLSNEILEEIIGFSASYFKNNIEPNRVTNKEMRSMARQGFRRCQYTLSQLNCWMEVGVTSDSSLPLVFRLY